MILNSIGWGIMAGCVYFAIFIYKRMRKILPAALFALSVFIVTI